MNFILLPQLFAIWKSKNYFKNIDKQTKIGVDKRRPTKILIMIKPNNHAFNVSTVSAEAEARLRTRGRARADL